MLITPTMVAIAKMRSATERRKALRALVTPTMERWGRKAVASHLTRSPLIGEGAERLNIRTTPSGLRDALPENVLWMIALLRRGAAEPDRRRDRLDDANLRAINLVLSAIIDPKGCGVKQKGAKTGFSLGENALVADIDFREEVLAIAAAHAEEATVEVRAAGLRVAAVYAKAFTSEHRVIKVINHPGEDPDLELFHGKLPADEAGKVKTPSGAIHRGADAILKEGEDAEADTAHESKETPIVKRSLIKFELPKDKAQRDLVDFALKGADLPSLKELKERLDESTDAAAARERAETEAEKLRKSLEALKAKKADAPLKVEATGELPNGEVSWVSAQEVFGLPKSVKLFDFKVPIWTWDAPHPDVPEADPDYIWQPIPLLGALRAIVEDDRVWMVGHTGTGKTTLIEQIAAHLNWPCIRINFDSEISSAALVGRDTIVTNEDGATISRFEDGVLPKMLSGPYIGILDELDFIRPDIAYVMQSALEGNGLVINDDGGRRVERHPWNRIFATGNTVGQGDETGLYQGARPQSGAMLDRFAAFLRVEYMSEEDRRSLITSAVPSLQSRDVELVVKYSTEHIEAFTAAKILQPLSPRGMIAMARWISAYVELFPGSSRKRAIEEALNATILDRATQQDRTVIYGIAQRVFAL